MKTNKGGVFLPVMPMSFVDKLCDKLHSHCVAQSLSCEVSERLSFDTSCVRTKQSFVSH